MRFTLRRPQLADGINFVAVAVGLFAFAEIIASGSRADATRSVDREDHAACCRREPTCERRGSRSCAAPRSARCSASCPGTGPLISSFASYAMERSSPRDPSRFGNGAIEGVAGPEAANNAAAFTHFIPMLTLGHSGRRGHGADARRADDPGHHARARA